MITLESSVAAQQAAGAVPRVISATRAFTGAAGNGAVGTAEWFTKTAGVIIVAGWWERCSEDVAGAATLSTGTTLDPDGLASSTADATVIDSGEWNSGAGTWVAGTGRNTISAAHADDWPIAIHETSIFSTIGSANITDGTITVYCQYYSVDGAVLSKATGTT